MTILDLFPSNLLARRAARAKPAPSEWDYAAAPVRERHLVFDLNCDCYATHREAWCAAIEVASVCGLLDEDLRRRLTGHDDDLFRGAIAECMVARFFADSGFAVSPRPPGRGRKQLDMAIRRHDVDAQVEVKAPYVLRTWNVTIGHDAPILRDCIEKAGRQFREGIANLLVIAPAIREPVYMLRDQLLEAVVGEHVIRFQIPVVEGIDTPEPHADFDQNGKLAKLRGSPEQVKTDLTRISAVMTIEDSFEQGHLVPRVVVVHNPFAAVPIPETAFDSWPQWISKGDEMYWLPPHDRE